MRPVRLRHAWNVYPKGHVFTAMPAAQAQVMVECGQAEYADAAPAAPVQASLLPGEYADRQMTGARRGRRAV